MRSLSLLSHARLLAKLGQMEWRTGRQRVEPSLWKSGFFSDRAGLYPLDRFPHDLFLNDWEIEARLGRINPPESLAFLGDKLLFHLLLDRLGLDVRRPVLAGLVTAGQYIPVGAFASWAEAASEPLIIKPVSGSGGRGVTRLERGSPLPNAGSHLVERCIVPHPYGQRIFGGAINTVRVMTARDPRSGEPFILGAAHRFGTAHSAPTDNRKQGGLVSAIAPETGILSAAIGLGAGNQREVHDRHPETSGPIQGVTIPFWQELTDAALTLARAFPGLHLVGWDLAVDETGPVVVEGNAALPNPNLLQAHAPLLLDARARDFLQHHGIITRARALRAQGLSRAWPSSSRS